MQRADSYMNILIVVSFLAYLKKMNSKNYLVTGHSFSPFPNGNPILLSFSQDGGQVSVAPTVVRQQTLVTPRSHGTLWAWP